MQKEKGLSNCCSFLFSESCKEQNSEENQIRMAYFPLKMVKDVKLFQSIDTVLNAGRGRFLQQLNVAIIFKLWQNSESG